MVPWRSLQRDIIKHPRGVFGRTFRKSNCNTASAGTADSTASENAAMEARALDGRILRVRRGVDGSYVATLNHHDQSKNSHHQP